MHTRLYRVDFVLVADPDYVDDPAALPLGSVIAACVDDAFGALAALRGHSDLGSMLDDMATSIDHIAYCIGGVSDDE